MLRDKLVAWSHEVQRNVRNASVDARNRATGVAAELRGGWQPDHANDATIEQRVRSAMGREVTHTRLVKVSVDDGVLTLSGSVPAEEIDGLLKTAAKVRGVRQVVNHLTTQEAPAKYSN